MKALFKRLLRREIGFTLVELAITMLVVGILSAIAVPAFLGARNSGYDKEAQASVDAAMSAAMNHYAQYGDFSSGNSVLCENWASSLHNDLQKLEPNLDFVFGFNGSTGPRVVSVAAYPTANSNNEPLGCQAFWASALSRTGTCWIGRIMVEGKIQIIAPIIVQGDKNTQNEQQVALTDAPLNGNSFAAFKVQSSAADQSARAIQTLAAAKSICNGFDSYEGVFETSGTKRLVRSFEYYDSWRNVVSGIETATEDED
jgi:prepilin-type N-terminal cleavage/methylation domain-containing protein